MSAPTESDRLRLLLKPWVRTTNRVRFLSDVLSIAIWHGSTHWSDVIDVEREPEHHLVVRALIEDTDTEERYEASLDTIAHGLTLLRTDYRQPVVQLRKADRMNGHEGRITHMTADIALQHGLFEWTKYGYSPEF